MKKKICFNCVNGPNFRSDGIIENFLEMQGTESARCTIFRSDAVVFFGRIPLVGRSVEGSDELRSVALPPVAPNMHDLAFVYIEGHALCVSPLDQVIQGLLQCGHIIGIPDDICRLCVISKLIHQ